MPPAASNLSKPRRILIVRLSAHGDTVQTLPLLTAIKRQHPEAFVGWLVEASAAPLLQGHPLIDRLHVSDRKAWLKRLGRSVWNPFRWGDCRAVLGEMTAFVGALRAERYEVAVDVQGLLKSALWPVLARIPRRVGYDRAREGASALYSETIAAMEIQNATQSAVRKYLEFLPPLGLNVPEVLSCDLPPVMEADTTWVRERLQGLSGRSIVALAPATRWESKHWPVTHWQVLLKKLMEAGHGVVLLGGPPDKALSNAVQAGVSSEHLLDLTGETRLPLLYDVFRHVDVLVGPDSAPLHIADAVSHAGSGPAIVALFGPTAPGRTGPVGPGHQALATQLACQPCFERHCPIKTHACMQELSPERVLAAVETALTRSQEGAL